ncbi:NAD(P)H-dependent FMN reductase [Azospirillum lipoferum]|uniref:NAD(P)H-dependent oxidoreductase n=1 Tax=Azospirillum lipoferum TaxID=193 RepID=A0A5A9GX85_AZOLI|nr:MULTISPECIES: NADPH-dependent FMN reductase [Azospirillum]KAA0598069.1 NAD(P)H-dependent oxidoreductase [Azospirillum lipoferum]MCP1613819.1 NAD(P)H-dependent FMN reductase [Azospirillum lipoferum]MDW5534729.1 NADPH-dependent FMN reductase [Azospirillum sp. NL1]
MRVLAISGSLRAASTNSALLRAAAAAASEGVTVTVFAGLDGYGVGSLPPFNPDEDGDPALPAVKAFREALTAADAVVIACPEYAHGVPGALKNALDWVVASGEMVDKPVALLHASPRSTYAREALTEILTVISARLISEASVTVPLMGKTLDEAAATLARPESVAVLRNALAAIEVAVAAGTAH